MSNGSVAPSCPISHSQPTSRPRQPPAVEVNHIPPAHDLRSVINAINIMNNVVQHVTRGEPQVNNVFIPGGSVIPNTTVLIRQPPQHWHEDGRNYAQQRITNPDDKTQFVEIKTLSYVSWAEDRTWHTLTYQGTHR